MDIGFQIDLGWSKQQLEEAPFGSFLRKMQNLRFESQSFRLYKDFVSLRPLSRSEAEAKPAFDLVKPCIDRRAQEDASVHTTIRSTDCAVQTPLYER